MTTEEKNLGRRWFEEVWNKGRREAIGEMLAPESIVHEAGLDTPGIEGFYPFFDHLRAAFSEIQVNVDDTFADGDKSCVRWSFTAKHTGEGLGVAPSGVTVHVTGISIFRIKDNKLIEGWQNWDMLAMMEQIKGVGKTATYIGVPLKTTATSHHA
jgi:predicted ester cyclase